MKHEIVTISKEVRLARIKFAEEVGKGKVFEKGTMTLSDFIAKVEGKLGYKVRITKINGEPQFVTMDLRMGRVNVEVAGATEIIEMVKVEDDMKEYYPGEEYHKYKTFDTSTAFVEKVVDFG